MVDCELVAFAVRRRSAALFGRKRFPASDRQRSSRHCERFDQIRQLLPSVKDVLLWLAGRRDVGAVEHRAVWFLRQQFELGFGRIVANLPARFVRFENNDGRRQSNVDRNPRNVAHLSKY